MARTSYGPKADNLQQLAASGYNVPAFYVVDAAVYKHITQQSVQSELLASLHEWRQTHQISKVAVRSSSTQEDSTEQSFAGQFATVLDVGRDDEFIEALRTVLSSKQSSAYSKKSGKVHAIVQAFVEADISGVCFSVNPASGASEIVINAACGRGTKVVDGSEAEQYFVDRLDPSNFRAQLAGQPASLSKAQIRELSDVIVGIEQLFGSPQDVEWAIKGGTLYVLQARPITSIHHVRLWDSSNIAESFPGIVLPLTFSIAKRGYLLGYKAQAYAGGMSWYELEEQHRNFDSMIGIFNGKMYYNLLSWYRYISLFPGSKKNQRFLDDQIATQGQALYQAPRRLSSWYKMRYIARLTYRVLFFDWELRRFYARFGRFEHDMNRLPIVGDTQLLMSRYEHIEQTIIPHFGRTLDNDFLVMTYHGWLKKLLAEWIPEQRMEQQSIIGSMSGVMSVRQATLLYELASAIKQNDEAYRLLREARYPELETHLHGSKVAADIGHYLEVFGHRFAEDQKIESVNPVLQKYGIYPLLDVYAKLDSAEVADRLGSAASKSLEIERQVTRRLRIDRKVTYRILLRKLKKHLRLREQNRLLRGKVYGYMRELFPYVGESLVREKAIRSWDDIYYLQIDELYQLMQGSLIHNDLQDRIDKRREAYKGFAKIDMPERFMTTKLPSLEEVQNVTGAAESPRGTQNLQGLISSPGTVEGRVLVLHEPKIPDEPFDILVASHTDPGWTPLIALAKGVIVEHGGMLSHAAIVTRELGIPSIIGVPGATAVLKTGMKVRINTQTSTVDILE